MFRKIDYICLWIRPVLNSFWNCFSYSDKGCITPCINFITCFIWCCFWPPSTEATFPFFYSVCVDSMAVFWGDNFDGGYGSTCRLVEIYVTTEFYLFSLIQFLSLEFQFHFEMSHYCFFVCLAAGSLFLLVLWLRLAFKKRNYYVCSLQDFVCWIYVEDWYCFFFLIHLHMMVCNFRLFFFLCEWYLHFLLKGIDFKY